MYGPNTVNRAKERDFMKLVIIFGPHAVGKMTIGQALARQTGLKVFHNHMTIDPLMELFGHAPPERSCLTDLFREEIFQAFAKTDAEGSIIPRISSAHREQKSITSSLRRILIYLLNAIKRKIGFPISYSNEAWRHLRQSSAKSKVSIGLTPIQGKS